MSFRLISILVAAVIVLPAASQRTAEETAKTLKGPPGFEAVVVASEPMLANPTAVEMDSRGRWWVAEGLNYRFFRNDDFKRVPGADKIKILEDTDGDGRADKVTVFAENIYPVPMGLAIQEIWKDGRYAGCRVFTGNSPDLLCLEDTDGDDKADVRKPLLTGFGGWDSDHGVHGMFLGPDGKLYFTQGDGKFGGDKGFKPPPGSTLFVKDASGHTVVNYREGSVMRCSLDGSHLQVLAAGLRNDYEAAVSSSGDVFVSDNDDDGNRGCRACWILPGADYGYHTRGSTRHWAEEVPSVTPKIVGMGNGSPSGIAVYEGNLFPADCRGAVLQVDAGTRRIHKLPLTRAGAGYRTVNEVLVEGDDPHYRPIDVCTGGDGSLYIADWYDAGVGGHRFTDQKTGRIYRLAPKGHPHTKSAPDFKSIGGLLASLTSPNVVTRFAASQALLKQPGTAEAVLAALEKEKNAVQRARLLYLAMQYPLNVQSQTIALILKTPTPADVEILLRLRHAEVAEKGPEKSTGTPLGLFATQPLLGRLDPKGVGPHLATVRREALLLSANQSQLSEDMFKLVQAWDGSDRFYLSAIRLGLKSLSPEQKTVLFTKLLARVPASSEDVELPLPPFFPLGGNDAYLLPTDRGPAATPASKLIGVAWVLESVESLPVLQQLLDRQPTETVAKGVQSVLTRFNDPQVLDVLLAIFSKAESDPDRQAALLEIIGDRLARDWSEVRKTSRLLPTLERAWARPETQTAVIRLIGKRPPAGLPDTLFRDFEDRIRVVLRNENAPLESREAALTALNSWATPYIESFIREQVQQCRGKDRLSPMAAAGLNAIASSGSVQREINLLAEVIRDEKMPLELRRRAVQVMAGETISARRLLDLHKVRAFPTTVRDDVAYRLNNHADAKVRERASKEMPLPIVAGRKWGDASKLLSIAANSDKGRALFFGDSASACGKCHRVQGVGEWVGPDLSAIGVKYDSKEMLYHILQPSGAVSFGFQQWNIELSTGQALAGLIVEETPDRVTIKTADGRRRVVPVSEITLRKSSPLSLMPEKLADTMSDGQIADLLSYLSSLKQPIVEIAEVALDIDGTPRRTQAGRDGILELPIADAKRASAAFQIMSPSAQDMELVFSGRAEVTTATVNGLEHAVPPGKRVSSALRAGLNEISLSCRASKDGGDLSIVVVSPKIVRASITHPAKPAGKSSTGNGAGDKP